MGMGPGAWKEGSLMSWGFSPKEDVVAKASLSDLRVGFCLKSTDV